MIHNFLDAPKNWIMRILDICCPNQNFHPLGLFKNKDSKELKFPTLFYGQF
jgi:hypothetical protein